MLPVNPWPKGGQPGDPGSTNWDTNNVTIVVKDINTGANSTQLVAKDTGLHPWRQQYRLGPFNWTADASVMKSFRIAERVRLNFYGDVFNIFNVQGLNTPASDGIASLQSSFGGFGIRPRQMQLKLRLEF
jgi:hypothetical protein